MSGPHSVSLGSIGSNPGLGTSVPDNGGKLSFDEMRSIWFSPDWVAIAGIIASAPEACGGQCKVPSASSQASSPRLLSSQDPATPQALSLQPRSANSSASTTGGGAHAAANGQPAANAQGSSSSSQKLPKLTIPGTLQDPSGKSAIMEVLRAIWGLPCFKAAVKYMERNFSQKFGKADRAAVLTQSVIVGSGVVGGMLANTAARHAALLKLSGKKIPVPGTGLSFRIYARKEPNSGASHVTGGAIHIKTKPLEWGHGFNLITLPNGDTIVNEQFMITLDIQWIINHIRSNRR